LFGLGFFLGILLGVLVLLDLGGRGFDGFNGLFDGFFRHHVRGGFGLDGDFAQQVGQGIGREGIFGGFRDRLFDVGRFINAFLDGFLDRGLFGGEYREEVGNGSSMGALPRDFFDGLGHTSSAATVLDCFFGRVLFAGISASRSAKGSSMAGSSAGFLRWPRTTSSAATSRQLLRPRALRRGYREQIGEGSSPWRFFCGDFLWPRARLLRCDHPRQLFSTACASAGMSPSRSAKGSYHGGFGESLLRRRGPRPGPVPRGRFLRRGFIAEAASRRPNHSIWAEAPAARASEQIKEASNET
jgi:hypothetical protein